MNIEVWTDFACPFCYIGKRKLEKAISNFKNKEKINIIYRSYELNPHANEKAALNSLEEFAKNKNMPIKQVKDMFNQISNSAEQYNLNYDMENIKMVSTRKAHRLAKWAREFNKEHEISEILFDSYFTKGFNIANNEVLLEIVDRIGLNKEKALEVLNSNLYDDVVKNEINTARQIGVRGVPFFVFDGKLAISGAQPDLLFEQTLNRAFNERVEIEEVSTDSDDICGPDGCAI